MSLRSEDCLPCRHGLAPAQVESAKNVLANLADDAPQILAKYGIPPSAWPALLRAAVESLRGTNSATTSDKRRFIEAVLDYGVSHKAFVSWNFEGTGGRQDYRVELSGGRLVAVEAKGCPDGNNTTIWDRPPWAHEFVVWCLCPESLVHEPGAGVWSGISTRLIPKVAAEEKVVDAFIFWDGRCGSELRKCPKARSFGVSGPLRSKATDILGDPPGWLPPPCIYLFPQSAPRPRNPRPATHTLATCRFANSLLELFNVPAAVRAQHVHEVKTAARGVPAGTQIQVSVTSRDWPDGRDRMVAGDWKLLKRD